MKSNSKKIVILLILGLVFPLILNYNFNLSDDFKHKVDKPKTSATYDYIIIDALATTNTTFYGNWSWARAQPWCTTGDGTKEYPYIIEDVTIIYPPAIDCLTIRNSRKYFIVRNCTFKDIPVASFAGLRLNNVTNGMIVDNQIYNNTYGIKCSNVNNSQFIDNNCSNNLNYGMYFDVSDNITISGNTANNNSIGIYLWDNSDNNTISGNTANGGGYGIYLNDKCEYNTISGNTVNNNTDSGIELYYECHNNTISGNTANSNGDSGMFFDESDNNTISGNTANNNSLGIYLYFSDNNTVSGNTAYDNIDGIYLEESYGNTISGNTANGNSQDGLFFYFCDYNNISGNTANENSRNGIYLEGDCDNNIISGNTAIDNNGGSGIRLENGDNNTILGNIANDNEVGMHFFNSHYNNITENTANDNYYDQNGIELFSCNNNIISGNTASNNEKLSQGTGIYLDDCVNNTITGNIACKNTYTGIFLTTNCYNNTISGNTLSDNNYGMSIGNNCDDNTIYGNFFLINGKHAVDNGTNNDWNSTTIGNYWDNHTGPDALPNDGIVDIQYNISGSAGSVDYLPIAEDGPPTITINSPSGNDVIGSNAPSYDDTITDDYLDEMWYTLDGGLHNYTFTGSTGTIDQTAWDGLSDGANTLTFYASDIPGNIGTAEVNIVKDATGPVIVISSPSLGDSAGANAPTFVITITDDHLDSIWYSLNGGLTNYSITTNATIDQTAWTALSEGSITITFYANDTLGNEASEDVIITKSIPPVGDDPTIVIVIVIVSIVGGVALLGVILVILEKKGKISLEKIKKLLFRRK